MTGYRLSQGWLPHIGRPMYQRSTIIPWLVIVLPKRPAEDRPLWPITFYFEQNLATATIGCEKEYLETWKMLLVNNKILLLSLITSAQVFSQSKITNMSEIIENFRRSAVQYSRRILSLKIRAIIDAQDILEKAYCVDLNILTHAYCASFISLQMMIKMQCFGHARQSQYGMTKNGICQNNS